MKLLKSSILFENQFQINNDRNTYLALYFK